ncbi:MAG: hypothetical protein WAZ30_09555 [Syntrophorhabdus sp.]|jgi:small-conductance mechanosensitive channel
MGISDQIDENTGVSWSELYWKLLAIILCPVRIVLKSLIWVLIAFWRNIRVFAPIIFICGSFLAGTIFEEAIRQCYPPFSGVLLISFVVMVCGVVIAIIERSIILLILSIFVSAIVPSMHAYLVNYWQVMVKIIFGGF